MKTSALRQEHEDLNARMSALGVNPNLSVADRHGIGLIVHAAFEASEGDYSPTPCLMINLCTAHLGRMRRIGDGPRLEGVLRPGTVAIALPNTAASGYWSKTQLLGIAVNLDALATLGEDMVDVEELHAAAAQLHNDPLLSAVMTALWRDAEVHALSGAFFEQGVQVLLRRLTACGRQVPVTPKAYALNNRKLQQVLDFMEASLGGDIRVSELAALTGQDLRSFTRSFAAATGLAPYAYFTQWRMERAKQLLRDSQLPVTEVALQLGYTNPSKFAAAFRRAHGIGPRDWRNSNDSQLLTPARQTP